MKTFLAAIPFAAGYLWQDLCLLGRGRIQLRDLIDGQTLLVFARAKHWHQERLWQQGGQGTRRQPIYQLLRHNVFHILTPPLVHDGAIVHDYRRHNT